VRLEDPAEQLALPPDPHTVGWDPERLFEDLGHGARGVAPGEGAERLRPLVLAEPLAELHRWSMIPEPGPRCQLARCHPGMGPDARDTAGGGGSGRFRGTRRQGASARRRPPRQILRAHQDLPGLRTVAGTDDAILLHEVDEARGLRIAEAQ